MKYNRLANNRRNLCYHNKFFFQRSVNTYYMVKLQVRSEGVCLRPWAFERVPGKSLRGLDNSIIYTSTKEACLAACLNEVISQIIRNFPHTIISMSVPFETIRISTIYKSNAFSMYLFNLYFTALFRFGRQRKMIRVLLSAGDCRFETLLVYGKSITTL